MRSHMKKRKVGPIGRRVITATHHLSYSLAKHFPNAIPITFVVGYPKSGTSWACQMVSDYLQLPFADMSYFPIGFPAVMHGHYRVWPDSPPMVYVARDGRDALVSLYFYLSRALPEGDHPNGFKNVPRWLNRCFPGATNRENVRENLPAFIEMQMQHPAGCRANWGEHVSSVEQSGRTDVPILKYEDMLADCPAALGAAMKMLTDKEPDEEAIKATVWKFSFERQSGRSRGTESRSNFLRKGQAGDWKNHFTNKAAEVFDRYVGEDLIRLGYENNREWIKNCG